jgi:leukotriene-A4 hydrolase
LGKLHGSQYRDFESLCGYNDLIKTVGDIGADHEFTKLVLNLVDIDPDESFSKIPYEKVC